MNCKVKGAPDEEEDSILEEIGDDMARYARRKTREKVESEVRGIPVVGDIMQAQNTFDLFNKYRKKDK